MEKDIESKYSFENYVYFSRWVSYWHQIRETLNLKPKNILIIGKGDAIAEDILKKYIKDVKTLDLNSKLKPDIIASVENMPLSDNTYDLVLCAEVLEHLPFEKFEKSLKELKRVAGKCVILTLPHFGPPVQLRFKIPFMPEIKMSFKMPFPIKHKSGGEHFWEIGKKGYSPREIKKLIEKYFKIKKEFVPFENQYHHFYVLEKI